MRKLFFAYISKGKQRLINTQAILQRIIPLLTNLNVLDHNLL